MYERRVFSLPYAVFNFKISGIRWGNEKSSKNMDRENSSAESLTKISLSILQTAVKKLAF